MMSIVLEGIDRTGKTTVINALIDYTSINYDYGIGWEYHYFSNPRKVAPDVKPFDYFMNIYKSASPHSIFSRSHISNIVYGDIFNSESDLTEEEVNQLDDELLKLYPTILVMCDEPERILSRWNNNEMFPPEYIPQIIAGFDTFLEGESLSTLSCYHTHEASLPQLVNENGITKELFELLQENVQLCRMGWANPRPFSSFTKFHYFDDKGISLCRGYGNIQVTHYELDNNNSDQNCRQCKKIWRKSNEKRQENNR